MAENDRDKFRIILIGSSLGGLSVIEKLLQYIPCGKYSVIIVQHMSEGYTGMWIERLNNITLFNVKEGCNGEHVEAGHAYIAPGNKHLLLDDRVFPVLAVNSDPPVKRFRPSIDVLFNSALIHPAERIIPVILSGMCDDGVDSIVELRKKGFLTIAQNGPSSAVFGMNREAIDRGGIEFVLSPDEMVEYFHRIEHEPGSGQGQVTQA